MPIDSSMLWRGSFSSVKESTAGTIVGNPITMTLIVTALSMAIIFAMLKPAASTRDIFRCSMYMVLGIGLVLYAHHNLMQDTVQKDLDKTGSGRIVSEIQHYRGGGNLAPIPSSFTTGMPQSAPAPAPAPVASNIEPMTVPNPWGFQQT